MTFGRRNVEQRSWHLGEGMVKIRNAAWMRNQRWLLMVRGGGFGEEQLYPYWSLVWKRANVIPIPKTYKNKLHTAQGYRGINLLSIPGKCLEKLVIGRLNHFLESTEQIPPQQYGFTARRSTADATKTVIQFARRSRKLELKCCLLALVIAGAFDNAWHPGILDRL